jgi:SpoIID/LytB domain protein
MKFIVAVLALLAPLSHAAERLSDQVVSVQLMEGERVITLKPSRPLSLMGGAGMAKRLSPSLYTLRLTKASPAKQRFHLFSKTFQPDEAVVERAYMETMRGKGFTPEIVVIGRQLQTASGRILDGRVRWVSIVQTGTEGAALSRQKELNGQDQYTWMQAETLEPGRGRVELLLTSGGASLGTFDTPVILKSDGSIAVSNVDVGFWKDDRQVQAYTGSLTVIIGPGGKLKLIERLPVETYLQGVLPAEMPSGWALEALKAQAVAARSEVLVNLATKHRLDGFDFCGTEHCRAYVGQGGAKEATNRALRETAGQIIVHEDRIVPTVFSATCGGWTENNDTVWFGPPNAALRGNADFSGGETAPRLSKSSMASWLKMTPTAYCSGDTRYFRWTRRYSEPEIRDMINKRIDVGSIKRIELGDRGVSGRLKWIRVYGNRGTEVIKKELPIRQALGGLPSAMFVLDTADINGTRTFTFTGGGRGHGVGMCQNGAQGMALQGIDYERILKHYFTGITLERYQQ